MTIEISDALELTNEQKERYLNSPVEIYPFCGRCGKFWYEVYRFVAIEVVEDGC